MKRLAFCVLCLALCLLAASPRASADSCEEGCCAQAQQDVEGYCWYSYVTYFYCVEGYAGSCCAFAYDCAPPWQ